MFLHGQRIFIKGYGTICPREPEMALFNKSGVTLYWHNIDPVPLNAKELTFIVTKLGGVEGRWEFRVALQ